MTESNVVIKRVRATGYSKYIETEHLKLLSSELSPIVPIIIEVGKEKK